MEHNSESKNLSPATTTYHHYTTMATTPNRPIRNNLNNDNAEDNAELAELRPPPCVRQSRREQQRAAQAMAPQMQAFGREDSEEEQDRVARIAQFAGRYNHGLGEIEDNDEDEVVN